jgi:hypothetical protein
MKCLIDRCRTKEIEVGDILGYPTQDHKFTYLCEIPFSVALAWLYDAYDRSQDHSTWQDISWRSFWTSFIHKDGEGQYQHTQASWHNKLAIVVNKDELRGITLAVYKHDSRLWLIQRQD